VPIANTSREWRYVLDKVISETLVKLEGQEPRKLKWSSGMDHMKEIAESALYYVDKIVDE